MRHPVTIILLSVSIFFAISGSTQAQTSAFVVNATTGSLDEITLSTMRPRTSGNVAATGSPQAFAFVPGSTLAYVATTHGIMVYDTAAQQAVSTVALPADPHSLAVSDDGARAFVTMPTANALAVIRVADNTVASTVTVGARPLGLALSRDGQRLYVANSAGRSISVIETSTYAVARTISLTTVDPAYVATTVDDQFLLITSVSDTNLTVLNIMFGDVFRSVALGGVAQSVTISPDGTRIHVAIPDRVVTIDATTFLTAGSMTDVGAPSAVAFTSNGSTGYVADRSGGKLIGFDPATLMPASTVSLSAGISAVALRRPMAPRSGWWWNPAEAGRGYSLEVSAWKITYSAYNFDSAGNPVWYLAYLETTDGETYAGDLLQYGNGQTINGTYRLPDLVGTVGPMSLKFSSPTVGTATHASAPMPVRRFDFVPNGTSLGRGSAMPQTGWWWNSNERGRGYFMEAQGSNLLFAAYMYDDKGNAAWYYASGTVNTSGVFQSSLWVCRNGQPLLDKSAYRQPVCTTDPGTITLRFHDAASATLTLPNGTRVEVTRFGF